MKIIILPLSILLFLYSCNKTNEPVVIKNKVLCLKIDYLTHNFEGGYELEFPDTTSFNISTSYTPAGDFGDIQLYYDEFDELLFDGTIIWSGKGQQTYPLIIEQSNSFNYSTINYPQPDSVLFNRIETSYFHFTDSTYNSLWNSINNLEKVISYRESNNQGKVNLFLYTPSIGVGNPKDWFWYIIINN